jgi:hypothetical protein
MQTNLKLTAKNDMNPKCPFCEEEITEIYYKTKGLGFIKGKNIIYFCPHCLKVIGLAQSRMA